jgi:predicted Zn-dependent peptidase
MSFETRLKTAFAGLLISASLVVCGVSSQAFAQQPSSPAAGDESKQGRAASPQVARDAKTTLPTVDAKASEALVTEFDVNGMKVLVKRRPGNQTVAAGLFIKGGSRNLTAQNAGIESLMLAVESEASQKYPRERMRSITSSIGTGISSGTSADYSVLSMGSTRANFDLSWDIFTDVVLNPLFTKQDVDLIKSRMITGLQSVNDDPDSYLQRLMEKSAYAGHPYLNDPQGTAETIAKLNPEDLKAHHQRIMQTSRLLLVIVGDLDANQLRSKIAAAFAKLPKGDYKATPIPPLNFDASSVDVTPGGPLLQTNYVRGLFTAPSLSAPDYYAMRVASAILNNRVLVEVRFRRNLSYAPEAFLDTEEANTGGLYVTAVDANQAVGVMLDEVDRLKKEPIDESDITATVAEFLTKYYMSQETNAAQAGELAKYEMLGGGWRNSYAFIDRLKAVTPEQVQQVSQKYMKNMRFVVLGKPEAVNKAIFTRQTGE